MLDVIEAAAAHATARQWCLPAIGGQQKGSLANRLVNNTSLEVETSP